MVSFASPLPTKNSGKWFPITRVQHPTSWLLEIASETLMATVVLQFVKNKIIQPFRYSNTMVSDNATAFLGSPIHNVMKIKGITQKSVQLYASRSNRGAKRMVGTIKHSITKLISDRSSDSDREPDKVLFGYRQRKLSCDYSLFELICEMHSRMHHLNHESLTTNATIYNCLLENLVCSAHQACIIKHLIVTVTPDTPKNLQEAMRCLL